MSASTHRLIPLQAGHKYDMPSWTNFVTTPFACHSKLDKSNESILFYSEGVSKCICSLVRVTMKSSERNPQSFVQSSCQRRNLKCLRGRIRLKRQYNVYLQNKNMSTAIQDVVPSLSFRSWGTDANTA
eukprot:2736839-Pleurochrysis_carterae.AAC.2